MKLSKSWKSRKLWVFIGIGFYYSLLSTILLMNEFISEASWNSINSVILTVGFGVFVLGNLAERYINGMSNGIKDGKK